MNWGKGNILFYRCNAGTDDLNQLLCLFSHFPCCISNAIALPTLILVGTLGNLRWIGSNTKDDCKKTGASLLYEFSFDPSSSSSLLFICSFSSHFRLWFAFTYSHSVSQSVSLFNSHKNSMSCLFLPLLSQYEIQKAHWAIERDPLSNAHRMLQGKTTNIRDAGLVYVSSYIILP